MQGDVAGITNTITGGIYRGAAASVWRLNPVDSKMPPTTSVSGSSATLVQAGPNRARLALTGLMFEHEFSYNRAPHVPLPVPLLDALSARTRRHAPAALQSATASPPT